MHHGEFLRAASRDDELVYHIENDHQLADLDEQDRAIVAYVIKLNNEPSSVTQQDVQAMRDTGLEDRTILDVCMMICLFNFMNRLADGIGIRPEENFLKAKARADARMEESLQTAKASVS